MTIREFMSSYRRRLQETADMYAKYLGYAVAKGDKQAEESHRRDCINAVRRLEAFDDFVRELDAGIRSGDITQDGNSDG